MYTSIRAQKAPLLIAHRWVYQTASSKRVIKQLPVLSQAKAADEIICGCSEELGMGS